MNDEQNDRPDDANDAEHTLPLRPDAPQQAGSDQPGSGPDAPHIEGPDQPVSPYAPPASPAPGPQGPTSSAPGNQGGQHAGPPSQSPSQPSYAGPSSQVPGSQVPGNQAPGTHAPGNQAPGQPSYAPQSSQPNPRGWQSPGGLQSQQAALSGAPQGGARPPYAQSGPAPGAQPKPQRAKLSGGVWPAIAAMSLVIGLVGGGLGGYAVNKWVDDDNGSGNSSQGLSDDNVVTTPPLPSSDTSAKGEKTSQTGGIAAVAEVLLPSTVQIIADFKGEEGGATGSGFFLDKEGHVVTNNHVVADAADGGKITVVDHQGKRYPATVVGRSPVYDLAVLDVEGLKSVHPASLGSSKALKVGEQVVAIGSPLGLSSTVTSGIVSALNRPVTTGGDQDSQSFINAVQTDAAINPGNSGGPLVNLAGQVVGVNSAIATTGGSSVGSESGNIGVGFAIPIEQVRVTADQILSDGEARYPVIGATVRNDAEGGGAVVDSVVAGSPAEDSGLKKGDLITSIDDRPVTDNATLIVAIRSHLPGDTVTLNVKRDGESKKYDVKLDSKVG